MSTSRLWCHLRSPVAHARLISQQFKTEYDERTTLEDHQLQVTAPYESTYVHPRARNVTSLMLSLNVYTHSCGCGPEPSVRCKTMLEINRMTRWVPEFVQKLGKLQAVEIAFGINSARCCPRLWSLHNMLETLPLTTSIETVYFPHDHKSPGCFNGQLPSRLLAIWAPGEGLQVDEAAVEQCLTQEAVTMFEHLKQYWGKSSSVHHKGI